MKIVCYLLKQDQIKTNKGILKVGIWITIKYFFLAKKINELFYDDVYLSSYNNCLLLLVKFYFFWYCIL